MPFHTQLIITTLSGALTFCLALGAAGALIQRSKHSLPPIPVFPGSAFPGIFTKFYTAFFLITFTLSAIIECMQPGVQQLHDEELPGLILSGALQVLLYLPLIIVYFAQPSQRRERTTLARKALWCIAGLVLLFIPAVILQVSGFNDWLIETTGCPAQQNVVEYMQHSSLSVKITLAVMAVIIAPITEECCFRGCLYNILRQYSSPILASLASGLLFGAIHTSLAQMVQLTLFGIMQCYAYEKARSLWLPIALHMLFNATSVAVLFLCPMPY